MAKIDKFLHFLAENKGSDLHVKTGTPPLLRIDGKLERMKMSPFKAEQVKALAMEIMPDKNRKEWESTNDTDFAYEIPDLGRFRTNIYRDIQGPAICMRMIPFEMLTVDDLGLPAPIRNLALLPKGIVLCTGPTGCGKTTTLAALLEYANKRRKDHIITIEDPVEFVHENEGCIISHREVGEHTQGFQRALRAGLREDPDIILVGELRDLETTALALESAETGHLVFGTVHTTTASSTVDRIIDQFPPDQQAQIRVMLANTLKCVITQMLCRKKGGGRVAAFEILYVHSAVTNLIRESKTFQLPSIIQTGKKYGMCTMNESLMELVYEGTITVDEAYSNSVDKQDMNERVNEYLLYAVTEGDMTPVEAVSQSYFRPGMMDRLRDAGYSKVVEKMDLDQFEEKTAMGAT
ncbi:MAG: type IV pilus twitching motility protein PilT [Candidatus Brocadiia bacterium]